MTLWLWLLACAGTLTELGPLDGRPVKAGGEAQVVVVRDEVSFIEASYLVEVNGRGEGMLDTKEYLVVDVAPGPVRL